MGNTSSGNRNMLQLQRMGFSEDAARFALETTRNDLNAAVDLLTQQTSAVAAATSQQGANNQRAGGSADATAREQRFLAAEARLNNNPLSRMRTAGGTKSSAVPKSNGARTTTKSSASDTSGDEGKIQGLAQRLAPYPTAVDTLVYAIDTIMKNPGVRKYRELKMTNKNFAKSVGVAGRAAIDFLSAMGFQKSGEWQVLKREDPARLWLGKSALESVKESPGYIQARNNIAFEKAMKESRESATEEEARRREIYAPLIPIEPALGAAGTTIMRVFMGDAPLVERRFGSDEKLEKVVFWLGGMFSSLIPEKLESKEWELMNNTLYPRTLINLEEDRDKTLHALGLWPSAELRVQVAGTLANSPELA